LTCRADQSGWTAKTSAAAPATWGVAIEVPDMRPKPAPGSVERMSSPGANRSTLVAPTFENVDGASVAVEAPTQRMFASGYAQGYSRATPSLSAPSFPAATTKSVFGWSWIASRSTDAAYGEPSDAVTTRMPRSPASSKACATSALEPRPDASSTRRGTSSACGATPAAPKPFSAAATVPATCVPCPLRSCGTSSRST
jgi:hypothetical protein